MIVFTACTEQNSSNSNKVLQPTELFSEPSRPAGQQDALELRCEPIDTVHVGFIGLGNRGSGAVSRYTNLKRAKITAICDLVPWKIERAKKIMSKM